MNVPIISGIDPNSRFASDELALVVRSSQDLQNKHLTIGKIGQIADDLHRAVVGIQTQVERMPEITTDDIYARAGALLKVIKDAIKGGEVERKLVTNPIMTLKESVDALFKSVVGTPLAAAGTKVENAMLAYARAKREKERAEAEAEQKRIRDEAARLAAIAKAAGEDETAAQITSASEKLAAQAAPQMAAVESHGVKSQVAVRKEVVVEDLRKALGYIQQSASDSELAAITSLAPRALLAFAKRVAGGELSTELKLPGLKIVEVDGIRNY